MDTKEVNSYRRIAEIMNFNARDILFLTDKSSGILIEVFIEL